MTSVALTPALQAVIASLNSRSEHTPSTLANALRRAVSLDDVVPWIRFDAENYVRNLITVGNGWELRLLCWRPWQASSMHGHGPAACAFHVLRGSAQESILGERDRVWAPGDVVEESREKLVHQISNVGNESLLTLHAYSPALPVDAPSRRRGHEVVIVGGGFSGVAAAIHLLKRGGADLRITLVERGPLLGRGIAYGVDSGVFRLNVPAARMSLDPDDPADFVRWAGVESTPHAFLTRTQYGAYVVDQLNQAIRNGAGKVRLVRGDAIAADENGVTLSSGRRLPAERVILATGIAPRIQVSGLIDDSRLIDAWDETALAATPRTGRILVMGSGLSALDVLSFLTAHGFSGEVDIISRRGLLPRRHVGPGPVPRPSPEQIAAAPSDLRAMLRWGRTMIREAQRQGHTWQHAIDGLRPHISDLWRKLGASDRSKFVRLVRPYWDVLRHRAPAEALDIVEEWSAAGRLRMRRGRVLACSAQTDGLDVTVASDQGAATQRYACVIRCIGPAIDGLDAGTPLVKALVESGLAAPDPAGLGIQTDSSGRVVAPSGKASERVFTIGALRRASDWETTAVPEIAAQALALARSVLP